MAPDRAALDAAQSAGLAAVGTKEGDPDLRPHYAPDYHGAHMRDSDGNKLSLVHRPSKR